MNIQEKTYRLKEKKSSFRESAKIYLKYLIFQIINNLNTNILLTHLNTKNVARLIQIFKIESCLRLDEKYRIATTIFDDIFQNDFRKFSLTKLDFVRKDNFLKLKFDFSINLNCLYNKYRIAIAKNIFIVDKK